MNNRQISLRRQNGILFCLIFLFGISAIFSIWMVRVHYKNQMQCIIGCAYSQNEEMAEQIMAQLFCGGKTDAGSRQDMMELGMTAAIRNGYTKDGFSLLNEQFMPVSVCFLTSIFFVLLLSGICILLFRKENVLKRKETDMNYELKHLTEEKEQMKTYYQEREQDLQTFMENVAHQIKTPLSSIMMNLETIDLSDKNQSQRKIDRSLLHIEKIKKFIMTLLHTARLQSGKLHFSKNIMDMREVLQDIKADYEEVETKVTEEYIDEGENESLFEIHADREWLIEAVENIISNGLVYGKVKVELSASKDFVYLNVYDMGVGITKEEQKHLFDRYYIGSGKKNDSTGIGLHLSYLVISAHGGDILVHDAEYGGCQIEIKIPKYQLKQKNKLIS